MIEKKISLPVIGWREWAALPDLGVSQIKVKVDTGARTSTLHADDIVEINRGRKKLVQFKIHPIQHSDSLCIFAEAPLLEKRRVKDSGGKVTMRPVILTPIQIGERLWEIELTLVGRDEMGFRMLLGRQAVRKAFLIHPGKSYIQGRRSKLKTNSE